MSLATTTKKLEALEESLAAVESIANEAVESAAKEFVAALVKNSKNPGAYVESFHFEMDSSGEIVVSFFPASEDVKVEELGRAPFDMKSALLSYGASAVKVSKEGYLYKHIPMTKNLIPNSRIKDETEAEQTMQQKVKDAINKAKFYMFSAGKTGSGFQVEDKSKDDIAKGIFRVRTFKSAEAYEKKQFGKISAVVMRTMSTNPESKSVWYNPGHGGNNFLPIVKNWVETTGAKMKREIIGTLIDTYLKGI